MSSHTTRAGEPKILPSCTYPLTAEGVVDRIYTDLAVLDVEPHGLVAREIVPGLSADDLQSMTGASLTFPEDVLVLRP